MYKIYRYELNQLGPYAFDNEDYFKKDMNFFLDFRNRLFDAHSKLRSDRHPCIRVDVDADVLSKSLYCACETLEQLNAWFDGFKDDLLLLGFTLVEIEVNEIVKTKSGLQCLFNPKNILAKKVLENLYN